MPPLLFPYQYFLFCFPALLFAATLPLSIHTIDTKDRRKSKHSLDACSVPARGLRVEQQSASEKTTFRKSARKGQAVGWGGARNHEPQRGTGAAGRERRRENKVVPRARDWLQQRAERVPNRHRTALEVLTQRRWDSFCLHAMFWLALSLRSSCFLTPRSLQSMFASFNEGFCEEMVGGISSRVLMWKQQLYLIGPLGGDSRERERERERDKLAAAHVGCFFASFFCVSVCSREETHARAGTVGRYLFLLIF